jgi:hypothetical protein
MVFFNIKLIGGGQIKINNNIKFSKDKLENITKIYRQVKTYDIFEDESLLIFLNNLKKDKNINLHATYKSIEKININPLTIKW